MNEFSEDTSKQCRFCSAKKLLITLKRKTDVKIRKLIEVTIGIKIEENDYYNNVCLNCITFAYNIHVYKENTQIREDKLKGFLKERNMHQTHKSPVKPTKNNNLYNVCIDISSIGDWIKDRRQDLLKHCDNAILLKNRPLQKISIGIQVGKSNSTVAVQTELCTKNKGVQVKNCNSSVAAVQTKLLTTDIGIQVKDCNSSAAVQTERYTMDVGIQGEDCNSNAVVPLKPDTMDIGIQVKNCISSVALQTELSAMDFNNKLCNEIPFNSVCMQIDDFQLKKRKLNDVSEEYLKSLKLIKVDEQMIHQNDSCEITTPRHTRRRAMEKAAEPLTVETTSLSNMHNDSIHIKTSPRSNTPVNSVSESLLIPYTGENLVLCTICDAAVAPKTLKKHERIHRKCSICKKSFRTVKKFKDHRTECLGGIITRGMTISLNRLETLEEIMKQHPNVLPSGHN
ncbi:uncharacterized protein LOC126889467 [Diabrotica virgifera virgifera]|uniref:Uncharacterized protein n=1 Tax=Diabrotica virgifera virgifera TaxID=50390 RepID=A0ABM5KU79_DIAVI|nr:uncharacterized protein LOC126889467 [Diabrotica virgifera virgifera]